MEIKHHTDLLHKELSYQIQGAAIEVRKNFGPGHKESLYQNAFAEELHSRGIKFEKEKNIKIHSPKTGGIVGYYRPDFIIEDKVIVELKAVEKIPRIFIDQLYDYLRNSNYELGYFINFASPKLYTKRVIFTNDRKFGGLKKLLVAISIILVAFSVSYPAYGSEFKIDVGDEIIGVGQQFETRVALDTQNNSINAVEGEIDFSSEFLELKEIRDGGSIVNFWVERPSVNTLKTANINTNGRELSGPSSDISGKLVFSGIVPGGYNGQDGLIFSLIFEAKKEGTSDILMNNMQALLNNGKGSEDAVAAQKLSLKIEKTGGAAVFSISDSNPPEDFKPILGRSTDMFGGKWFVSFVAQDKQSGVDYYQVQERLFSWPDKNKWIHADSPYALKNQWRLNYVFVRAMDKSGNERISVLSPIISIYKLLVIFAIIIVGLTFFIFRRIWRRKHE